MKKIIILLVVVLMFGFIGCGGDDSDGGGGNNTVTIPAELRGLYTHNTEGYEVLVEENKITVSGVSSVTPPDNVNEIIFSDIVISLNAVTGTYQKYQVQIIIGYIGYTSISFSINNQTYLGHGFYESNINWTKS